MTDPIVLLIGGFVLLIGLILLGFPVVVAGAIGGIIGLLIEGGIPTMLNFVAIIPYSEICLYSYTVVPLFILMGSILVLGGIAEDMLELSWHVCYTSIRK